jgi:sulfate adenylyltransferase
MNVGITLFFTGLSGAGKSTLARIMRAKLIENGQRPVTLLDGDVVRQNLSSELGFSKVHRDLNIRRIGFVANEICKNGGVAICASIAPYRATRREIRGLIEQQGVFVEIYLSTPLAVCEERDPKGLYFKARAGEILQFTGVSDPYELPERAELVIDTSKATPIESCGQILNYLIGRGLVDFSRE